ncbi:MAG: hypothetical protein JJT78_11970 [Leptospira sp.]|nr:hypothetical protein [Leptospira sp.]
MVRFKEKFSSVILIFLFLFFMVFEVHSQDEELNPESESSKEELESNISSDKKQNQPEVVKDTAVESEGSESSSNRKADDIDEDKEEAMRSLIPDLTYQKKSGLGTAVSKIYFSDQRFTISGFLEANSVSYRGEKSREGGDLELYYTNLYRSGTYFGYKITDNIIFNSEVQVEYLTDGNREDDVELNVEALVDFLIHPSFNLRVGNFPIPLGYININEEPVMFHSVNRPDVERILIPTQWLEFGGMIFGSIVAGFDYNIAVMQGLNASNYTEGSWIRSGRDFEYNGMQDLAYMGKLEWNGLDDFTLGIGAYIGRSGQGERTADGKKIEGEVSIGVLNMFYKYELLQFTAVLVSGRMTDTEKIFEISGNIMGERVYGGYLDIGLDVLPFLKEPMPFLKSSYGVIVFGRYERLDTHDKIHQDLINVDRSQKDLSIWTFGFNYKPTKEMVFKLNYQRRNNAYKNPNILDDPDRIEVGFGFIY